MCQLTSPLYPFLLFWPGAFCPRRMMAAPSTHHIPVRGRRNMETSSRRPEPGYIIVMGMTGSGKTTFISRLTGPHTEIGVGHTLSSSQPSTQLPLSTKLTPSKAQSTQPATPSCPPPPPAAPSSSSTPPASTTPPAPTPPSCKPSPTNSPPCTAPAAPSSASSSSTASPTSASPGPPSRPFASCNGSAALKTTTG